jgi:hypothetical protein
MMLSRFRQPLLVLCCAFYLLFLFVTPALAGMIATVRSDQHSAEQDREAEMGKIQRALETEIVKEKLKAYGITPDEINQKLQGLTDDQIHMLAQASEDILAGADDGLGVLIAILLIILIVILIMKLSGKSVVAK